MARIVIAEDQAHIRNVLTMWMTRHGHEVRPASTGRQAYEILQGYPADLLITDVNMPEMDGIELAAAAFGVCASLKGVFVVTSRCDQHEIFTQLSDPRVHVFPKPFSPSQLLRDVENVVGAAPSSVEIASS
ncbi:MAG: response regulator [Phycisphaerae bacterium]